MPQLTLFLNFIAAQ